MNNENKFSVLLNTEKIMDSRVNVALRNVIEAIKDLGVGDAIMILEQVKFECQMDAWEKYKAESKIK